MFNDNKKILSETDLNFNSTTIDITNHTNKTIEDENNISDSKLTETTNSISETLDITMMCLSKRLGHKLYEDTSASISSLRNKAISNVTLSTVIPNKYLHENLSINPTEEKNNRTNNTKVTTNSISDKNNNSYNHVDESHDKASNYLQSTTARETIVWDSEKENELDLAVNSATNTNPMPQPPIVFFEDGYYPSKDFLPKAMDENTIPQFTNRRRIEKEDEGKYNSKSGDNMKSKGKKTNDINHNEHHHLNDKRGGSETYENDRKDIITREKDTMMKNKILSGRGIMNGGDIPNEIFEGIRKNEFNIV